MLNIDFMHFLYKMRIDIFLFYSALNYFHIFFLLFLIE